MEEKKSIKIKFKTAVILIIIAVLLLGICGANVYASTHGYGNVFFLIKYLITGEKTEITGKNDLLSDRDITISYEPILLTEDIKIQIRNLQIKDNKAKLIMAINESKENDVTPLKYKVYNEYNKSICEQNSSNSNNQPGEYTEELILNEFKNEDKVLNLEIFNSKNEKLTRININLETREVTIEEEKEAINKISEVELKRFLGSVSALEPYKNSEDERILFAHSMMAEKENLKVDYDKLDEVNKMLDATGYELLTNPLKNADYFKIVNKGGTKYIEVTEGRGGFEPNTVIDIKDISYCGGIYTTKFNYTFIHEPDAFNMSHLEELDIKDATVYFKLNEDKTYSTFKVIKYIKENDESNNNADTHIENIVSNNTNIENNNNTNSKTTENNESTYTKTEYEKAVESIKEKLLDKSWLKEHTLIKSTNGNSNSIDEQEYKFAVIKEQDTQNPVVVLVVTAEKILTENTFVIRYKNNNVSIKKVSEGHYQHIQTFTNEKYYATVSAHMGDWAYELIEVTSNDIGVMDRNHGKVGQDEYEYLEIDEFERNYNLQLVATDLNENNLNRFLNSQNNIITQLSPSGFAGSSLNIVELNSNKEVYLTILTDAGDRNNIASKELIAKNVNSISKTAEGDIVVKGGDKVKSTPNWIHFEK